MALANSVIPCAVGGRKVCEDLFGLGACCFTEYVIEENVKPSFAESVTAIAYAELDIPTKKG